MNSSNPRFRKSVTQLRSMSRLFTLRLIQRSLIVSLVLACASAMGAAQNEPALGDDPDPVRLFERGQAAHARGDFERALALYEEAIKVRPEFPEAEFQKGAALISLNRLADLLVQGIVVDEFAQSALAGTYIDQQFLRLGSDRVQAPVQFLVFHEFADVAFTALHSRQQLVGTVHNTLQDFEQVGALRHEFRNVLGLQAAQCGALLDRLRVDTLADVDEFVPEKISRADAHSLRHRACQRRGDRFADRGDWPDGTGRIAAGAADRHHRGQPLPDQRDVRVGGADRGPRRNPRRPLERSAEP